MYEGTYVYRFSGSSLRGSATWQLVGVGTMTIAGGLITEGHHSASTMQMDATYPLFQVGEYTTSGSWKKGDVEDQFTAEIFFTHTLKLPNGKPMQELRADFALVRAGERDGFWMISKETYNISKDEPAFEIVTGEAIRIRKPSP